MMHAFNLNWKIVRSFVGDSFVECNFFFFRDEGEKLKREIWTLRLMEDDGDETLGHV